MKSEIKVELKRLLGPRKKDSHKGDYGHIFILAGSRGLTGAAALCAAACLRSGAGLVTLGIPRSLNNIMEVKLTEVITCPLNETEKGTISLGAYKEILEKVGICDVAILGPGVSQHPETQRLLLRLLPEIKKRLVLDADALNAVATDIDILRHIKKDCVVTPHPGELSRLIKKSIDYIKNNRVNVAKNFSSKYNTVTALKGSATVVVGKDVKSQIYINKTGNPGMATAGSGDVLTGVIGGFLAQGLDTFDAARLAVYVHGMAGDLAAKEKGETGLIASDILEKIPEAIKSLQRQ